MIAYSKWAARTAAVFFTFHSSRKEKGTKKENRQGSELAVFLGRFLQPAGQHLDTWPKLEATEAGVFILSDSVSEENGGCVRLGRRGLTGGDD